MTAAAAEASDRAQVLTKALLNASQLMGLSQRDLALSTGVSEATVSRWRRAQATIGPTSKEGELGLLLVRAFRSLDALVGGNEQQLRTWMHAHNRHLGGTPAELVRRTDGLVHVVDYLDAMRGKL